MRTVFALSIAALICTPYPDSELSAQVQMGVSVTDEGLKGFYLALGDYFQVPEKEVIVIKERRIPDDELPVVLFIAKRARVTPAAIIELRLPAKTWMDIAFHLGLSAEIFYVEVGDVTDPPYGRAYGHFKKTPRKEWKKIVLLDEDVINLVNLRFVSEHYGYSTHEVIKMRAKGKTFVRIHDDVRKAKGYQKGKIKEKKGKETKGTKKQGAP